MILIKALLCALIYLEEEIMSTAHNNANIEDVAKVVLMPGDPLRAKLIAENFSDEKGLIWPENVAPAKIYLVQIGEKSCELAEEIYAELTTKGVEVLFDDRD